MTRTGGTVRVFRARELQHSVIDLLQSDGWERFQIALGRTAERVDGVLVIVMPLSFGLRYLYSPRSSLPRHLERVPSDSLRTGSGESKDPVVRAVHDTRPIFWRAECPTPPSTPPDGSGGVCGRSLIAPRVLRRALEPEWTWRTSLEGTEDEILGRMHEKHRYNVRLAERKGVTLHASSPPLPPLSPEGRGGVHGGEVHQKDLDVCWSLLQDTAQRQGISTHPRAYYETMLRVLPATRLHLAEHDGATITCAIVAYHGDTATYLHGGSSHAHRNLMAPHLLHWMAMREAKMAGMQWYDWGGIAPLDAATHHDWDGMTRFKRGFGGEAVHHPAMRDLVFRPAWYTMLATFARLRR